MSTGQSSAYQSPQTPLLAVDLIIDRGAGLVVLIKRKNEPEGLWALPGGFVEVGESIEEAAIREAKEESGLDVEIVRQFHVYSDPGRDQRAHCVSVVFIARAGCDPVADSDAMEAGLFHEMNLPENMAFDHKDILRDYFIERY